MNKKKIIIILSLIVIISILIGITLYYLKFNKNIVGNEENFYNEENGIKINTSSKLKEEKVFNNIKVTDINLINENGITEFTANVQNIGETDLEEKDILILFKDQTGNEYAKVHAYLPSLQKGEMNTISASIVEDKVNAYDFEFIFDF